MQYIIKYAEYVDLPKEAVKREKCVVVLKLWSVNAPSLTRY